MDTDVACPSCHASRASALSSAPGEFTKPSGLVTMLPMFGGAVGGAIAGAIIAGSSSGGTLHSPVQSAAAPAARGRSPLKLMFGVFLILGGLLFLGIGGVMFYDTWKIAQWVPKDVTAAELSKVKDPKTYPGPWLSYTFEESKPIDINVTRPRMNNGGDVQAHGLLVQVEDKWMFVSVAPGFEGNRLVGRLAPIDAGPSKALIEKFRKIEPKATLLPCEFIAVDGCESDQCQRYSGAGLSGFLGLLGLLPGLFLCRKRRMA
jgi:hypothetical protein